MAVDRPRRVRVTRYPPSRRLVTAALRTGKRMVPMYGLVQMDVTRARQLLHAHEPPLSMTAYLVACLARAASAHPEVHAYRNWRGQLVLHDYVDVVTMIEIATPDGPFALPHVLHDADLRTVEDLTTEVRRVQDQPLSQGTGRWFQRLGPIGTHVPGTARALYAVMARSTAARRRTGTVALTAVGMFAAGGGFGITPMTIMTLELVVGGISRQPRLVSGRTEPRDMLDLTLIIDHNVVDGAPAARFGADLRTLVESASALLG
jgi:pyruvate/2-oxoglutarate dehydrogenase complex dihydrolipoamide acyltransferase (E2) component